jgi:hypothetical protein
MHHHDLKGLIPTELKRYEVVGSETDSEGSTDNDRESVGEGGSSNPRTHRRTISDISDASSYSVNPAVRKSSSVSSLGLGREERMIGSVAESVPTLRPRLLSLSSAPLGLAHLRRKRATQIDEGRRRPTAVRIRTATRSGPHLPLSEDMPRINVISSTPATSTLRSGAVKLPEETGLGERQPLIMKGIKAGVVPDERRDSTAVTDAQVSEATQVVELGLPIMCVKPFSHLRDPVGSLMGHSSIAHEIARSLYKLRRLGCLEAVGPAGYNAMQTLIQNMTDQLGNMERIV